jgi:protein involved in polysaccharide export with SLBB domain
MKRSLSFIVYFTVAVIMSYSQAPGFAAANAGATGPGAGGFGAAGAANAAFQGGDPAQINQRIISSTRYKITPGDIYQLSITTDTTSSFPLILQENYDIDIPYMGTINVKGMYFNDLRTMVTQGVKKVLRLAQFVSLTLQSPARFDVAVFGGVQKPGMVTVYPLSRVSEVIALAGKLPAGSYRQISLIRGEKKIAIDLLKYSAEGASEENPYLEPGDRIYVPPALLTVSLSGEVKFPGPYELIPGENLQALLAYAGGTLADARTASIEIVRFNPDGSTTQKILDLASGADSVLADSDRIRVPSIVENRDMVLVTGAVFGTPISTDKPIQIPPLPVSVNIPYTPGLSLISVLEALGGPTPYAKAREGLIIRKKTGDRITVDMDALWASRDPAKDITLEPGDTVEVPIVNEVFVAGEVRTPGKLPYNPALVVSDYLVASGGINPDTADANGIYFVDRTGLKTKVGLTSNVAPGTVIVVSPNAWIDTQKQLANITVVTAFVTSIVAFLTVVINFVRIFVP